MGFLTTLIYTFLLVGMCKGRLCFAHQRIVVNLSIFMNSVISSPKHLSYLFLSGYINILKMNINFNAKHQKFAPTHFKETFTEDSQRNKSSTLCEGKGIVKQPHYLKRLEFHRY